MLAKRRLATLFSILAVKYIATQVLAIEVTELAGAAYGPNVSSTLRILQTPPRYRQQIVCSSQTKTLMSAQIFRSMSRAKGYIFDRRLAYYQKDRRSW